MLLITRRVLSPFFGRLGRKERHNEARSIPHNVVNVGHNEARLISNLWEKQGEERHNEARLIFHLPENKVDNEARLILNLWEEQA